LPLSCAATNVWWSKVVLCRLTCCAANSIELQVGAAARRAGPAASGSSQQAGGRETQARAERRLRYMLGVDLAYDSRTGVDTAEFIG
jgi:hypothetical protein